MPASRAQVEMGSNTDTGEPPSPANPRTKCICTIGYERRSIGEFLAELLAIGTHVVIDVRRSASSRKTGFSGEALARIARKVGLDYRHLPSLGVIREHRDGFRLLRTVPHARSAYKKRVEREATDALAEATSLCAAGNAVLLCYERDVRHCHRYALSEILASKTEMNVQHL